jgi:hypothetical protein
VLTAEGVAVRGYDPGRAAADGCARNTLEDARVHEPEPKVLGRRAVVSKTSSQGLANRGAGPLAVVTDRTELAARAVVGDQVVADPDAALGTPANETDARLLTLLTPKRGVGGHGSIHSAGPGLRPGPADARLALGGVGETGNLVATPSV